MLAGLAAAPVAGLPAASRAFEADPILEALAEYERFHAIEKAAWEAVPDDEPAFPDVFFNGECVFDINYLETMRQRAMGMTDEELEEAIARLRDR